MEDSIKIYNVVVNNKILSYQNIFSFKSLNVAIDFAIDEFENICIDKENCYENNYSRGNENLLLKICLKSGNFVQIVESDLQ